MPNQLARFALHADDLDCARKFCGGVFGWKFQRQSGPLADFCQIQDASGISIHQSLRGFNG